MFKWLTLEWLSWETLTTMLMFSMTVHQLSEHGSGFTWVWWILLVLLVIWSLIKITLWFLMNKEA